VDEVRFVSGSKLIAVVATPQEIRQALELAYGQPAEPEPSARRAQEDVDIGQLTLRLTSEGGADEASDQQAPATDSTLVKLVNKMIVDAVDQKASDIHIEVNPAGKNVRVRFRKDGVLVNYFEMPARFRSARSEERRVGKVCGC